MLQGDKLDKLRKSLKLSLSDEYNPINLGISEDELNDMLKAVDIEPDENK